MRQPRRGKWCQPRNLGKMPASPILVACTFSLGLAASSFGRRSRLAWLRAVYRGYGTFTNSEPLPALQWLHESLEGV